MAVNEWTPVVKNGTLVDTPQGQGRVRRVSSNGYVHVERNGQLFEVKTEDVKAVVEAPKRQTPAQPHSIKQGDRVQHKSTEGEGTVTEVTQRTVRVKWDNTGRINSYPKRDISKILNKAGNNPGGSPGQEGKPEGKPEDKPEGKPEGKQPEQDAVSKAGDGLHEIFQLKDYLEKKIDKDVDGELSELREQVKKTRQLEVKIGDRVNVVKGLKHKQLEQLINYASLRLSPLLVGMAGTGKTHAAEQVADALGMSFYAMSVGAQTSKSDIIGYMDASGNYVTSHFRQAYEFGGVFLMDEIDAGNSNVLIQINAALSNGYMSFPDAMVRKHEDFIFIASANTFGNGANRQYVGRNQLDAATLDRFAVIEWFIDDELESSLTTGLNGKAWYMAVKAARDYVAEKGIRALISPRATQKGSKLLHIGQDLKEVIHATMLGSVPEDKRADVEQVASTVFNKFASEVKGELPTAVKAEVEDLIIPF